MNAFLHYEMDMSLCEEQTKFYYCMDISFVVSKRSMC